jgi:small GTP-binding protein
MEKYKIILIGPAGCGKSTFIMQLKEEEEKIYSDVNKYDPTIGVDFYSKKLSNNYKDLKINIWDTAGQERFDCIVNSYYKDVDMVILLYDVNENDKDYTINKWCKKTNHFIR